MATIGEVKSEIKSEHEIEWKVHNFSSLSVENSVCYSSPTFLFCKESWYLKMYPNGSWKRSTGYISLFLYPKSCSSPINVGYTLGLKTLSGQKAEEIYCEYTFTEAEGGYGCSKLFLKSRIFEEKADLLSNDVITVFCSLKFPTSNETPIKNIATEKCSICEKIVDADNLLFHQKKDKPIKCPDCSAVFTLKDWCDHECQVQNTDCEPISALSNDHLPESSKILTDFKELFLNQEECDVVIKVKDREFSAHKAMLIARSSVFKSTFRNDMKEKTSGTINIKDCDPTSFSDFLCFLYCEDLGNLSDDNVFSLFATADKYDVTNLKAKCVEFIKNNLSVDTFCDAITLALQYSETELIKSATVFFAKNLQKIIVTVKWQAFAAEYPTWSNELFIKALVTDKNSDA